MVELILSNSKTYAETKLFETIRSQYSLHSKYIIITPDRLTLKFEQKILKKLGLSGAMNIDVFSFSRLAVKFNNFSKNCLTPEGAVMLMSKVIFSIKDELRFYKKSYQKDGFVRDMYSTITAIRNSSISPTMLYNMVDSLPSSLQVKTLDIALIYNQYLIELNKSYYDGTTRIMSFVEYLEEHNPFSQTHIYIVGFDTFNGQCMSLISKLMTHANSLTISLCSEARFNNSVYYPSSTKKRLLDMAKMCNIAIKQTYAIFDDSFTNEIEEKLYSYQKGNCYTEKLQLFRAISIDREVEYVAYCIKKEIRDGNGLYKNYAICCNDIESYKDTINKYFNLFDIPVHIDSDEKINSNLYIKIIIDMLKVVKNNYKRENVFKLLKNSLVMIDKPSLFELENYCIKYNINYNYLLEQSSYKDEKLLEIANHSIMLLNNLKKLEVYGTTQSIITSLLNVLQTFNIEENIARVSDELLKINENKSSEILAGIAIKVQSVFDNMIMILGDRQLNIDEFIELFVNTISNEKMVLLPISNDCVQVRTLDNSYFDDINTLFVIGAREGNFPMEISAQTILSLKEAVEWHKHNCLFEPTQKDNYYLGKFNALQLLMSDYKKLIITYAENSDSGELIMLSSIAKQLSKIFNLPINNVSDVINWSSLNAKNVQATASILATQKNAKRIFYERVIRGTVDESQRASNMLELGVYDAIYKMLEDSDKANLNQLVSNQTHRLENVDTLSLYFGHNKNTVSVSQLEKYFNCPYSHYVSYGLKAREREIAELQSFDIGNIVHEVLEVFFKASDYNNIQEKITMILDRIIQRDEYKGMLVGKQMQSIVEYIKNECYDITMRLVDYENNSDFKPDATQLEVNFESCKFVSSKRSVYKKGDTIIAFVGKIDRVDVFDNNIIIIDYKTGIVSSKYSDIYFGEKTQLPFYMYCMLDNARPAGLLYVPISNNYSKDCEKDKKILFEGIYNSDIEIVNSIDKRLEKNGFSQVIKAKLKKDGTLSKQLGRGVSEKQLKDICEYTNAITVNAINEILDGYYEKKPHDNSCRYCPIKDSCDYLVNGKIRSLKGNVTIDSFALEHAEEIDE